MSSDDLAAGFLFIIIMIIIVIIWDCKMNKIFNEAQPQPIARERKDLNKKIRI